MDQDECNERTGLLRPRNRDLTNISHEEPHSTRWSHPVSFLSQEEPQPVRRSHPVSVPGGSEIRHRTRTLSDGDNDSMAQDLGFECLNRPENRVEAHRMANNYMFGFRKWKSHVTQRPLSERSGVVQELYADVDKMEARAGTCSVGNVVYLVLFGWWLALIYCTVAAVMAVSILGYKYSKFCLKMARYFLWPFGKFVHKNVPEHVDTVMQESTDFASDEMQANGRGYMSLDGQVSVTPPAAVDWEKVWNHRETKYWTRPGTYVWLALGVPLLFVIHGLVFILCGLLTVLIPISKLNWKVMQRILLLPPELLRIDNTSLNTTSSGDIIVYTHQAVNVNYYKYTIDGVNIICVNLLSFVIFALCMGYLDKDDNFTTKNVKFVLSLVAIIPLAYYIGMAISSISAQTSFAIGAVLNATFGSVVEIILYVTALKNGKSSTLCYVDLVKASLVGTLLATTTFIPGLSMIVGGIKHSSQNFNPKSAGITATLLFVSIAGVFAPSIFSRAYGTMTCARCSKFPAVDDHDNRTWGLDCDQCRYSMMGNHTRQKEFFDAHISPLVYCCALILPLAYLIGLIYSLKTHSAQIYDAFTSEIANTDGNTGDSHHSVHWGKLKSFLILLVAVVLMSLCAELVTVNIEPLLTESGVSVNFIGVTMLAIIPDIPEILIGIQFALQNNISLSIEVGSCIAVQVCMVQIPLLVLANLIYPVNFFLIFSDIHIWSVVICVLLNNYTFQDGKSNYFQGSALVLTYLALITMYFFSPNTSAESCGWS